MAYAGKNAFVTLSATGVTLTAVATTAADGKTFQVAATSAQGEPFPALESVTVATSSGGTVSSTAYTLYRLNGSVVFPTSSTNAYTITGSYLPTATVSNAHAYDYEITAENLDVTTFLSSYRKRMQDTLDASASIQDFHATPSMAQLLVSSSQPVALTFHASSTSSFDTRMWAFVSGDGISGGVGAVVDGTVDFEGSADLDGRVVTFTTRGTSG